MIWTIRARIGRGPERCASQRWFPSLALVMLLASCGEALTPPDFAGAGPRLEPERFFEGHTHSRGVFEGRDGAPQSRFRTDAIGRREGDALVLVQTFAFEDARTQRRVWHLRRIDAHRYEATADDVVGVARGEAHGNAFRWTYTLALEPGNPIKTVDLTHWMFLQDGGDVLVNRAKISKLGITLGGVTEYFRRLPPDTTGLERESGQRSPPTAGRSAPRRNVSRELSRY